MEMYMTASHDNDVTKNDTTKDETTKDVCVICLEQVDSCATELPCGHVYHSACVIEYFHVNHKPECPLCRVMVVKEKTRNDIHIHIQEQPRLQEVEHVEVQEPLLIYEQRTSCSPLAMAIGVTLMVYWTISFLAYKIQG